MSVVGIIIIFLVNEIPLKIFGKNTFIVYFHSDVVFWVHCVHKLLVINLDVYEI